MSDWLLKASKWGLLVFIVLILASNAYAQEIIQIRLDPLTYATRTLEKNIQFSVTNYENSEIINIALKAEGLGENYIVIPSKISLKPGEKAEAVLSFTPSNLTDTEFYITAVSEKIYAKTGSRLVLLEIKEYFAKELNELESRKVETCSNDLKNLQLYIDEEKFINAKAVLERSWECVDTKKSEPSYFKWIVVVFTVILVLISAVLVIRKLRSFKGTNDNIPNIFDKKIKEIQEKLK